jgi:hypothetical protein
VSTPPPDFAAFLAQRKETLEAAQPSATPELLRRAALMRWIDAELYDGPLRLGLTPDGIPTFTDFVAREEMEPLADPPGAWFVRDSVRTRLLSEWRDRPAALQQFSAALVSWFELRESPLDLFTHRIFADPERALADFRTLYAEADRAFDLVRCDTLLRIVRNRNMCGPALTQALNDREQYYRSRSLFADDWLRTAHFLDRNAVTARVVTFFADEHRWILRLYAKGGVGKTAYLRWLISRLCVPEHGPIERRLPVARLDMDFLHLPVVASSPALLLIPFAEQLNVQLPGAPFTSFLQQWRKYSPNLQRPVTRGAATAPSQLEPARMDEIVAGFAASLAQENVLIVIDTLEELQLHFAEALQVLLLHFRTIRQRCPHLKLILSGRYDPFATPALAAPIRALRERSTALRLEVWTRSECWTYLREIRGLKTEMSLESFRRPGQGIPFKVSLIADLLDRTRPFTAADLRDLRRQEVEYLVLRVIERIPESECNLRWLLRYAVTAQQLTRDFVKEVIEPEMLEMTARTSSEASMLDNPVGNLPAGAEIVARRRPWPICAEPFSAEREWQALLRYASTSSWITVDGGQPRLQPEVVSPMRYLLQEQPVFAKIHNRAAEYFEGLATSTASNWAEMMSEAIYHRFQAEGADAAGYWRAALSDPRAALPAVRRRLAELLVSRDFLDESREPLAHRKTRAILNPHTHAEALLELVALDALEAEQAFTSPFFVRAAQNLREVRRIERQHGFSIESDGRRELVDAAIVARSGPGEALETLSAALTRIGQGAFSVPLLLLAGLVLEASGNPEQALRALSEAARLAACGASPYVPLWKVQLRLGMAAFGIRNLSLAEEHLGKLIGSTELSELSETELRSLLHALVMTGRLCCNWDNAGARLDGLTPQVAGRVRDTVHELRGQLALDRFEPEELLRDETYDERIRGLAAAMTGNFRDAAKLLEGFSHKKMLEVPAAGGSGFFPYIRLLMRDIRDYKRAGSLLTNLRDIGDLAANAALLQLEIDVKSGKLERAKARWFQLKTEATNWTIRRQAYALATALALELEPRIQFAGLLKLLAMVQPPLARLPLLKPFQRFAGVAPLQEGVPRSFASVLMAPRKDDPNFILQGLLLAEALRYFGERDIAASILQDALARAKPEAVQLQREIINAMFRLQLVPGDDKLFAYSHAADQQMLRWNHAGNVFQNFVRIVHLELAEWWVKRKEFSLARTMLIAAPQSGTQYTVRFLHLTGVLAHQGGNLESAASFFADARRLAEQLGMPYEGSVSEEKATPSLFAPEHQFVLWLPDPGTLEAILHPAGRSSLRGRKRLSSLPVLQALALFDWFVLSEALRNRDSLTAELRDVIPLALESASLGDERCDFRIDFSEADRLAGLPWEWSVPVNARFVYRGLQGREPSYDRVRWFIHRLEELGFPIEFTGDLSENVIAQIETAEHTLGVLADGWNGIVTKRNLAALRRRSNIVLIKQDSELERYGKMGYGSMNLDVERLYAAHGLPVTRVSPQSLTSSGWPAMLAEAGLIHLCLPLVEVNGQLQLSLFEDSYVTGPGLAPAFNIEPGPAGRRPIVVLDPPLPLREQFRAQQLVWRNIFARDLFEQSPVEAVIAAGLTSRPETFLEYFVQQVAAGEAAGKIVKELNVLCPDMAAALYAYDATVPTR